MSIDGNWTISIKTPMGEQSGELDLKSNGDTLSGTQTAMGETIPIEQGAVDGNDATWTVKTTKPFPITLAFSATVDGDSISGEAKGGPFPPAPFSGARA